jgi:hypothetical protein
MSDDWAEDDQLLLDRLGDALRARQNVPDWFVADGKSLYSWHGVDAELASLLSDSAVPATATTIRADQAEVRALTFTARSLTIELEITRHALRGQLVPPQIGELELELDEVDRLRTRADELGFFAFERAPTRSFRLHCRTEGHVVSTNWVTL